MYRLVFRKGLAVDWSSVNPVLTQGEPGYESDTGKFKIGDGSSKWSELKYVNSTSANDGTVAPTPPSGLPGDDTDTPDYLAEHIASSTPHPAYDDGPSFVLLYENAKV